MKILVFVLFLFFPAIAQSAPSTTVSITPSAVDASTITASDVNTRNSAISIWANVHYHNDIDQAGNTLAVGDATAGNKTIQANNADTNKPFIRYDDTNDRWVISRDGSAVSTIIEVTGTTAAFILPQTISSNQHIKYLSGNYVGTSALANAAGNTQIQVEETVGENIVRIDTNGTERWIMSAAGERTMPTQPSFLANLNAAQNNIATGSAVTVLFGLEAFDQGSDYNNSTSIFTAPVTGKYFLGTNISMVAIDTSATQYVIAIVTSNRSHVLTIFPLMSGDYDHGYNWSALADMDINDTAYVTITQTAGTQQTDLTDGNGVQFYGHLEN